MWWRGKVVGSVGRERWVSCLSGAVVSTVDVVIVTTMKTIRRWSGTVVRKVGRERLVWGMVDRVGVLSSSDVSAVKGNDMLVVENDERNVFSDEDEPWE
jgi:hypothetical protein